MKQQHCASSLRPSRLCRILLLALGLKLTVLGFMMCEPLTASFVGAVTGTPVSAAPGVALAANSKAAAAAAPVAPPVLAPPPAQALPDGNLPDVGIQRPTPGKLSNQLTPGAIPGVAAQPAVPVVPVTIPNTTPRTLPAINRSLAAPTAMTPSIGGTPTPGAPGATGAPGDVDATSVASAGPSSVAPDIARDTLTRKQDDLARKEQELRSLEGDLSAKLEKMQILENRLKTMVQDAEETRDAKFRHLVDVLANMKGKNAAAMLETLDQRVAVKLLAGMRGRQAGEILTFVKPEVAAHLTEALARMQLPLE